MNKELTIPYFYYSSLNELSEVERKLFHLALDARKNAYAPYSEFLVGCALLLEDGEMVSGSNQENAAYPSGLCAERTAIFWASANHPGKKILKLFALGAPIKAPSKSALVPPCGACRQSILEYESRQDQGIEIYFATLEGEVCKTRSIRDLLPFSFDKSFL